MYRLTTLVVSVLVATPAWAQLAIPSDGSDGDLLIASNTTIDLSLAASMCDCDEGGVLDDVCRWDCPSPVEGQGIYDVEKWAVVYKYSSATINGSRTLSFANHPSRAPVVWLVQGDVTVAGTISANGGWNTGSSALASSPGPGGF